MVSKMVISANISPQNTSYVPRILRNGSKLADQNPH